MLMKNICEILFDPEGDISVRKKLSKREDVAKEKQKKKKKKKKMSDSEQHQRRFVHSFGPHSMYSSITKINATFDEN